MILSRFKYCNHYQLKLYHHSFDFLILTFLLKKLELMSSFFVIVLLSSSSTPYLFHEVFYPFISSVTFIAILIDMPIFHRIIFLFWPVRLELHLILLNLLFYHISYLTICLKVKQYLNLICYCSIPEMQSVSLVLT